MTLRTLLLALLGLFLTTGCPPATSTGDDDDATGDDDDAADDDDAMDDDDAADDDDATNECAEEDDLEPDDSYDEATVVVDGDSYTDRWVCPDDDDYYAFTATADGVLDVVLTFLHADGDVDLHLDLANGQNVANAVSSNDNEMLDYSVTTGETYYIYVESEFNDPGTPGNSYDISFEFN